MNVDLSRLPKHWGPSLRAIVFVGALECDEDHPWEVRRTPVHGIEGGSAFETFVRALGVNSRPKLRERLAAVESEGYISRRGHPRGIRIFMRLRTLLVRPAGGPPECEVCTAPIVNAVRGQRKCGVCRQVFRVDRTWQIRAEQLLVEGHSPAEIAKIVRRNLFIGDHATEEGKEEGVLTYLLRSMPELVPQPWHEAMRRYRENDTLDDG